MEFPLNFPWLSNSSPADKEPGTSPPSFANLFVSPGIPLPPHSARTRQYSDLSRREMEVDRLRKRCDEEEEEEAAPQQMRVNDLAAKVYPPEKRGTKRNHHVFKSTQDKSAYTQSNFVSKATFQELCDYLGKHEISYQEFPLLHEFFGCHLDGADTAKLVWNFLNAITTEQERCFIFSTSPNRNHITLYIKQNSEIQTIDYMIVKEGGYVKIQVHKDNNESFGLLDFTRYVEQEIDGTMINLEQNENFLLDQIEKSRQIRIQDRITEVNDCVMEVDRRYAMELLKECGIGTYLLYRESEDERSFGMAFISNTQEVKCECFRIIDSGQIMREDESFFYDSLEEKHTLEKWVENYHQGRLTIEQLLKIDGTNDHYRSESKKVRHISYNGLLNHYRDLGLITCDYISVLLAL